MRRRKCCGSYARSRAIVVAATWRLAPGLSRRDTQWRKRLMAITPPNRDTNSRQVDFGDTEGLSAPQFVVTLGPAPPNPRLRRAYAEGRSMQHVPALVSSRTSALVLAFSLG